MGYRRKFAVGATAAVFLALTFLGGWSWYRATEAAAGSIEIGTQPKVVISPLPVPFKRKVEVLIAGSGFEPNQELGLRLTIGGVLSDIRFQVKPEPVANEFGAFASQWVVDREIRKGLLKPKAYTLRVVDENGVVLAQAPLVFVKQEKKMS